MHCAQALGTPILGDYKYGRKVHEEWLCEADEECEAVENNDVVNTKPNRRRNATLPDVKGSITSEKPFLHLHSRLIAIPKVKELNKKKEESKEHTHYRRKNENVVFSICVCADKCIH